jgi:8-oxo-dGTP pyrophosphatase MutT (NUDIX family)
MKIPPKAKRVFEGTVFSVYQWEQELFDGSTAVFEATRRQPSVQVIATVDGKIVLGEQEQPGRKPFISLLGGVVDPGEEPLAAAQRELREEAGMVSDDWELIRTYEAPGRTEFLLYLYAARGCRVVDEQHLDAGEKIVLQYVTFDEFMLIAASDAFRNVDTAKDFLSKHYLGTIEEYKRKIFGK